MLKLLRTEMELQEKNRNPFSSVSGSSGIASPISLFLLLAGVLLSGLIITKLELIGVGVLFALVFILIYLYLLFKKPILGFYTLIVLGFTILGICRYITGLPLGFAADGVIVLTLIALIFSKFRERVDWSPTNKDVVYLGAIWLLYCVMEIVNPEARSIEAWIASRGIGIYFFLFGVLALMFVNNHKRLDTFLYIWAAFSILASFKGIIQLYVGLDYAEKAWLNAGAYQTHVLFGKLRVFSFFSDAGQFGADQAYTGVVAFIYSQTKKGFAKIFFIIASMLGFYGMIISGTRGAISVPFAGLMTYFVLRKNINVLIVGLVFIIGLFVFFKYTTIGQGNAQIRRMRTAFDPNDASFQVRLNNQKNI